MENKYRVLLFYRYIEIEKPELFAKNIKEFCIANNLRGRILVSCEGINGSVSGIIENCEIFKNYMWNDSRFSGLIFKEDETVEHPFKNMKTIVRGSVLPFDKKVDMSNKGTYLSPDEFIELYDNNGNLPENVLLLDARNYYEYDIGKFKGAIHLNTKTFREFPEAMKKIENAKGKKVVMYCTGGIRCEKASAYLKQEGFENVYHLRDGILNFGKKYPDTVWEGKCFVYDKRLVSSINTNDKEVGNCKLCGKVCELFRECKNVMCNEFYVSCGECKVNSSGCCSGECQKKFIEWSKARGKIKIARHMVS